MCARKNDWFSDLFAELDPERWGRKWNREWGPKRRRGPIFESGEMKYFVLRLIREKPRHGYEVIKEMEERFGGWYTPSPGTVYPTLQLLEDQGFVRVMEADGKKVYHITPDGEVFLDQNEDTIEGIFDRVRDTVRDFAGGAMADLNRAFARIAAASYKEAWRHGPNDPFTRRIVEILEKATADIQGLAGSTKEGADAKP
jgi:DNA-binding PadR family transcriptional regulator